MSKQRLFVQLDKIALDDLFIIISAKYKDGVQTRQAALLYSVRVASQLIRAETTPEIAAKKENGNVKSAPFDPVSAALAEIYK